MKKRVLVIGGYGNFGSFITRQLAKEDAIEVIIAGRSLDKAESLAHEVGGQAVRLDINDKLLECLENVKPDIVIHTSGPFQAQGYDVAKACIEVGSHYIDLADGREFVTNIVILDEQAKDKNVLVVSGASSVPCLTSALLDHYQNEFSIIDKVDYGITTAQKTARGLATTAAILSYTGKPFKTVVGGQDKIVHGWQGLRARRYRALGRRLLGYCDVPDLSLFRERYPNLKTIKFYAGLEIPFIHVTLWALSWLVRSGLIKRLEKAAPLLLKMSYLFDWLGSANSAFHMTLSGKDKNGEDKSLCFELTARSGDGPYIPCMPAILMTKKIISGMIQKTGAQPCIGLITKEEYLEALSGMDIEWGEI